MFQDFFTYSHLAGLLSGLAGFIFFGWIVFRTRSWCIFKVLSLENVPWKGRHPLFPSTRSAPDMHLDHGLIWLARRKRRSCIPVTRQPLSTLNTLSRNSACFVRTSRAVNVVVAARCRSIQTLASADCSSATPSSTGTRRITKTMAFRSSLREVDWISAISVRIKVCSPRYLYGLLLPKDWKSRSRFPLAW